MSKPQYLAARIEHVLLEIRKALSKGDVKGTSPLHVIASIARVACELQYAEPADRSNVVWAVLAKLAEGADGKADTEDDVLPLKTVLALRELLTNANQSSLLEDIVNVSMSAVEVTLQPATWPASTWLGVAATVVLLGASVAAWCMDRQECADSSWMKWVG